MRGRDPSLDSNIEDINHNVSFFAPTCVSNLSTSYFLLHLHGAPTYHPPIPISNPTNLSLQFVHLHFQLHSTTFSIQSTTSRTPSVSICNSVNLNLCHHRPKLASLSTNTAIDPPSPPFFLRTKDYEEQSATCKWKIALNLRRRAHHADHDAIPAKTKSHSTSSPSAPKTPGSSNKLSATALAAVHASNERQRKRQTCSARRRRIHPSSRARARARLLMKRCVVEDHLPPTITMSRALGKTRSDKFRVSSDSLRRSSHRDCHSLIESRSSPGRPIAVQGSSPVWCPTQIGLLQTRATRQQPLRVGDPSAAFGK